MRPRGAWGGAAALLAAVCGLPAIGAADDASAEASSGHATRVFRPDEKFRGLEAGGTIGLFLPDEDLTGGSADLEGLLGAHLGWAYDRRWVFHGNAQFGDMPTSTFAGDAEQLLGRIALDYQLTEGPDRWFVTAGGGYTEITFDNATDFTSGIASVGVGQRSRLLRDWQLRWELRVDQTLAEDGLRGNDLTQVQLGVTAMWGQRRAGKDNTDRDGDGVPDRRDACPDSPAGADVRRNGCSIDSDGDGVPDPIDRCPESPARQEVNASGCRVGDDFDGVPFERDDCPSTPEGAEVDFRGCPRDGDQDGVFDGLDRCPKTLRGIQVDERGCFLDADEDGVYDGLGQDRCPGTPKGTPVDRFGCPVN